jgi:hypothetical protein
LIASFEWFANQTYSRLSPRDEDPTAVTIERTCVLRVDDAINKSISKS